VWLEVPEGEVTQRELWEYAANFLADKYIIPAGERNAGQKLGAKTAVDSWRGLQNERRVAMRNSERAATQVNLARLPRAALVLRLRALVLISISISNYGAGRPSSATWPTTRQSWASGSGASFQICGVWWCSAR
jgi:hypothetical protein